MKFDRTVYAGHSSGNEHNDCAVRAVATAGALDYWDVHAEFTRSGRSDRHRTPNSITNAVIKRLFGVEFVRVNRKPGERMLTLGNFVAMNPKGHFVIYVRGHILAVTDGTIHDWNVRPKRFVKAYWKLA